MSCAFLENAQIVELQRKFRRCGSLGAGCYRCGSLEARCGSLEARCGSLYSNVTTTLMQQRFLNFRSIYFLDSQSSVDTRVYYATGHGSTTNYPPPPPNLYMNAPQIHIEYFILNLIKKFVLAF